MEYVSLGNTGRRTTRLGFGCVMADDSAAVLLDAAYDAGIRHFDVARSYGHGLSEVVLGKFLKRHSGDVTVTTKYGILPPIRHPFHAVLRRALKPVLAPLRQWKAVDQRVSRSISSRYTKAQFSVSEARQSLDQSLRNLNVDKVDLFLMHEPDSNDLDDNLLHFLQLSVAEGRIGQFGIGADARRANKIYAEKIAYCPVVQTNVVLYERSDSYPGSFRIHYRAIAQTLGVLCEYLVKFPNFKRFWSDQFGFDVGDKRMLGRLLLKVALAKNANSIVLFSSRDPDTIAANVRVATDHSLNDASMRLVKLLAEVQSSLERSASSG